MKNIFQKIGYGSNKNGSSNCWLSYSIQRAMKCWSWGNQCFFGDRWPKNCSICWSAPRHWVMNWDVQPTPCYMLPLGCWRNQCHGDFSWGFLIENEDFSRDSSGTPLKMRIWSDMNGDIMGQSNYNQALMKSFPQDLQDPQGMVIPPIRNPMMVGPGRITRAPIWQTNVL